ncbi:MAG: site-specific integrase [bacterium]
MKRDIKVLFTEFIRDCRFVTGLSHETIRGYEICFGTLIKLTPDLSIDSLHRATISLFFEQLENRERVVGKNTIKSGVKKSTLATYRSKLNTFFDWLVNNSYIKINPFHGMPYPRVYYDNIKYIKKNDIEKIFAAIWTSSSSFIRSRNYAIFKVLLFCGLRKNELLNIRLDDICLDFGNESLIVRPETSKSKRKRTLPLTKEVFPFLKVYLSERKKRKLTTQFLFTSDNHDNKLSHGGIKHLVERLVDKSKINFHLHQFRHTFAINMLVLGCGIVKLKELLGHSDIRMTMAYLRHIPPEAMRQDMDKLNPNDFI